jgi:hypothetical protein
MNKLKLIKMRAYLNEYVRLRSIQDTGYQALIRYKIVVELALNDQAGLG